MLSTNNKKTVQYKCIFIVSKAFCYVLFFCSFVSLQLKVPFIIIIRRNATFVEGLFCQNRDACVHPLELDSIRIPTSDSSAIDPFNCFLTMQKKDTIEVCVTHGIKNMCMCACMWVNVNRFPNRKTFLNDCSMIVVHKYQKSIKYIDLSYRYSIIDEIIILNNIILCVLLLFG